MLRVHVFGKKMHDFGKNMGVKGCESAFWVVFLQELNEVLLYISDIKTGTRKFVLNLLYPFIDGRLLLHIFIFVTSLLRDIQSLINYLIDTYISDLVYFESVYSQYLQLRNLWVWRL